MKGLLSSWINDSEALEMQRSYHVLNQEMFEFLERQDDFYITLLNRFYFLLEEVKDADYASKEHDLLELAKGLLIYSDKDTKDLFSLVDQVENMLYVASAYYLTGYEAIASLLLRHYPIEDYNNRYAWLIAFIIKGGKDYKPDNDEELDDLYRHLDLYIESGEEEFLSLLIERLDILCEKMLFATLDEFFDCNVLRHVLKKFCHNNLWGDLKKTELDVDWTDYVQFSKMQGILQFLPSQRDAIEKGLLTFEHSFSLKMPTSAGKSYITELLVFAEIRKNPEAKILYLAPLRSLSHELSERYEKVGDELGFDSFAAYGGNSSTLDNNRLNNAQVFITTPEFFASMEGGDETLLDQFTLVICDEGQLLDSLSRGASYELLLSRIKRRGVARFLFISAIIPNIEDVNTWLGGDREEVGDSMYRPCEIRLAVADRNKREINLNIYDSEFERVKFTISGFLTKRENVNVAIGSKVTLSAALGLKSANAGSTLIFTYSKTGKFGCQKVGDKLVDVLNLHHHDVRLIDDSNRQDIGKLAEYIAYQYGDDYPLAAYVRLGFAYHNGGLPQDIREYIEDYYRSRKIKILISNSTLAEGVNLPIKTLVVYNLTKYNFDLQRYELIESTEIRNILGRVGRAGREKYGLVILPRYEDVTFRTIVDALKGERIHQIRGIFYNVIQKLIEIGANLTDERVDEVLVKYGASSAIDQMIYRYYGGGDDVDVIQDCIQDSLAYHLSNQNDQQYIQRAFHVRYNRIEANVDHEHVDLLKQTGLELDDFLRLERINEDEIGTFNSDSVLDQTWLDKITDVIYTMPTMVYEKESLSGNVAEVIEDPSRRVEFLQLWMRGFQYREMADMMDLAVDEVMELLGQLQYQFHIRLQGLIRYMRAKYNFECDALNLLPDCLKFGVSNMHQIMIIKGGLKDRIAVHKVGQVVVDQELEYPDYRSLRRQLRRNRDALENYIGAMDIPVLSKEKIWQWIGR